MKVLRWADTFKRIGGITVQRLAHHLLARSGHSNYIDSPSPGVAHLPPPLHRALSVLMRRHSELISCLEVRYNLLLLVPWIFPSASPHTIQSNIDPRASLKRAYVSFRRVTIGCFLAVMKSLTFSFSGRVCIFRVCVSRACISEPGFRGLHLEPSISKKKDM